MIDSILWMLYNVCLTNIQMSQCFLFDQDAPMSCAAKINEDKITSPQDINTHYASPDRSMNISKISIYDQETADLGYSIAEYYHFCREEY